MRGGDALTRDVPQVRPLPRLLGRAGHQGGDHPGRRHPLPHRAALHLVSTLAAVPTTCSTVHSVQCMQYSVSSSPGQSQQTWSPAHNLSPLSGAQSIFHIWCRECSQQSLENMATFVNLSSSSISLDQNLNIVQIYQINIWHDLQVCPPHIRISSNIPFALKSGVC